MSEFTPFKKKLAIARYDKKKFGVGFAGGPAFWFIKERDNRNLNDDDGLIWANVIAAYNEKVQEREPK